MPPIQLSSILTSARHTLDTITTATEPSSTTSSITSSTTSLTSTTPSSTGILSCVLDSTHLVISRSTLIAVFSFCALVTILSTTLAAYLLFREWSRRREARSAHLWSQQNQQHRQHRRGHSRPSWSYDSDSSGSRSGSRDHGKRDVAAAKKAARLTHISSARKEVDDAFSRRFHGCWQNPHENPEMGSDSPVELALPEVGLYEAPTTVVGAEEDGRPEVPEKDVVRVSGKRKSRVVSLWFDNTIGLWRPSR